MKLLLTIIVLLFSAFSIQTDTRKIVIKYDYILPSKTEEQLEKEIQNVRNIIADEELRERVIALKLLDNKSITFKKKLICDGKRAFYTDEIIDNNSLKIGEYSVFFDVEKEEYLAQSYIFNKPFIVEKEIFKLNWTYLNETKQIGAFKAKKAIAKKDTTFFAEVWYTEDLPPFPIEGLFGLKGGVVEATFAEGQQLKLKNFSTTLSKEDSIEKPTKGKNISEKEYKLLEEQKIKEVNEHAKNSRKN
ncbi:GLPGLI family protein [Bernardetia litoralis]|nr:GLPGLI family protein [Bernardetia litoralis]